MELNLLEHLIITVAVMLSVKGKGATVRPVLFRRDLGRKEEELQRVTDLRSEVTLLVRSSQTWKRLYMSEKNLRFVLWH